jgi:hypothetical protein
MLPLIKSASLFRIRSYCSPVVNVRQQQRVACIALGERMLLTDVSTEPFSPFGRTGL